jgi:predicted SAM-dependent methyltransferase
MIKKIINKIKYLYKKYKERKELDFRYNEYNKLSKNYKNYQEIKLHFGCGPRVLRGWINIDLSFEPFGEYLKYYTDEHYPEKIRGNQNDFYAINILKTGLPLPDESVDVIFHEDFIEHLNQKDQVIFLAETFRVLKKDGIHRINTPELLESMKSSDFKKGFSGVYTQEWDKHIHLNVLTKNNLTEIAKMIGYSEVMFSSKDKSISPLIPKEYRPDIKDRPENGNLYADLIK